jgi:hypothetical protein
MLQRGVLFEGGDPRVPQQLTHNDALFHKPSE